MARATILFAGGGTGGHIYPNVAIAERLLERGDLQARGAPAPDTTAAAAGSPALAVEPLFLVSDRAGDRTILDRLGHAYVASPVQPLPGLTRPWRLFGFLARWRQAVREAETLLDEHRVLAVVATGGFVSGPAIVAAARRRDVALALVNLDAVPGVANRRLVRYRPDTFTVYDSPLLPGATRIGLPLRRASVGAGRDEARLEPGRARALLGLDAGRATLFVTGATHGAESIVRTLMALVSGPGNAGMFRGWQVFHQCGTIDPAGLERAYREASIPATVVPYCDRMGVAWQAADLAISRAGAGSVAEAWANRTPTVFLPNPFHRDQHQRRNAQPMVAAGGAVLVEDRIDAAANVAALVPVLDGLMTDASARAAMRKALEDSEPPDGAETLAAWVRDQIAVSSM